MFYFMLKNSSGSKYKVQVKLKLTDITNVALTVYYIYYNIPFESYYKP